jgi:hypothetical protein
MLFKYSTQWDPLILVQRNSVNFMSLLIFKEADGNVLIQSYLARTLFTAHQISARLCILKQANGKCLVIVFRQNNVPILWYTKACCHRKVTLTGPLLSVLF